MPLTPNDQPLKTSYSMPPMISSWYMPFRLDCVSSPPWMKRADPKSPIGFGVLPAAPYWYAKTVYSLPRARVWMSCGIVE